MNFHQRIWSFVQPLTLMAQVSWPMEKVYYQHQTLLFSALMVIFGAVMGLSILIIAAWFKFQDGSTGSIVFWTLVLFVVLPGLFGLYLFFRFSRYVVLTEKEIMVYDRWHKNSLYYSEIVAILDTDRRVPPNLVLVASKGELRIPRQIEDFFEFYTTLRIRSSIIRRLEQQVYMPWQLRVGGSYFLFNTSIFVAVLGLFALPVLIKIVDEPTPELWIVAALGVSPWIILYFFWFRLNEPVALSFGETEIEARFLFWYSKTWLVSQLRQVRFIEERKRQNTAVYTTGRIVLHFSEKEQVTIGTDRAWAFGYSPERLYFTLKHLYGERRKGEVLFLDG